MAKWSVTPSVKKSVVEYQEWSKDGQSFTYEIGWRWGEFIVYTDDDEPPELEEGVDIYCCGYESEVVGMDDGCWDETHYDDCDEETKEWLEEFLQDNSIYDLEEHGWTSGDTEVIINCEMNIERIDE